MRGRLATRLAGMVILGLVGFGIGMSVKDIRGVEAYDLWIILGTSIFGTATGFLLTPYTFVPLFRWAIKRIAEIPIRTLVSGTLGLIVGLIISILILLAFSVPDLPDPWDKIVPVLVSVTMGFLGLTVAVVREKEFIQFVGLRHGSSSKETAGTDLQGRSNGLAILVDTSVIIDGRLADITQTGFIDGGLIIPKFVLDELQYIADSPDSLRRNRGRRGLDVLNRLRKDKNMQVDIVDMEVPGADGVDSKLVSLAKSSNYPILTTDFNLNKVAELQGVKVLNINELANSLKPNLLPGEDMSIQITQEGKEEGQGVGFLDDGTMVVVEGGRKHINSELPITITRVLQTSAGRIIFAHLK
ncbi:MAG: PIN/TRAM domain-containing protein [Dehalococcoidia bacterium]